MRRNRGCESKRLRKEWVEGVAYTDAVKKFLTPQMIEIYATALGKEISRRVKRDPFLAVIEASLADTKKRKANILRFIEKNSDDVDLNDRYEELKEQERGLQKELREHKSSIPVVSKKRIEYCLDELSKAGPEDTERIRAVFNMFVPAVIIKSVGKDRLEFEYCLDFGENAFVQTHISDKVALAPKTRAYPKFYVLEGHAVIVCKTRHRYHSYDRLDSFGEINKMVFASI